VDKTELKAVRHCINRRAADHYGESKLDSEAEYGPVVMRMLHNQGMLGNWSTALQSRVL